ncbi:MAG: hypothetical protein OEQ25_15640 [Gammaproteobacteria bacterium]|nr:hypothetical protein [Gammaproteobacteria bacterium]
MRFFYIAVLSFGFFCSSVFAQEAAETTLAPGSSMDCEEAITVFHDVSGFGRRNRAAERMTEKHAEMALSGWRFADMVIYSENGDLEGFYLSYTRPAACATE